MSPFEEKPIYHALALPNEAISNGGVEILRAGVIDDELYVNARPAFADAAQWGEVLAEITRKLGTLYAAQTDLSEQEAIAEIEQAYMAGMGAKVVEPPRQKASPKQTSRKKSPAKTRAAASKRGAAKPKRAAAVSERGPAKSKRSPARRKH